MKLKTVCPCGHKSDYNSDKIVACPNSTFEKHATVIDIKVFKDEPATKDLYCKYRKYGGPTCVGDISKFTKKEYLILTDVYWYCGASSEKKRLVLI